MLPSWGDYINRWGRAGVFRRWRTERASALSPSLILDAVYSPPLSFPIREFIASVHISVFHQWQSCCGIILSCCDRETCKVIWVCSVEKNKTKQQKRNPLCAETLAYTSVWAYQQEETAFLMLKRIARHERCRCVMGSLALLEAAGPHGFMHLEEQSQRLSYQDDDDGIRDIWTTAQERFFKLYNSI